MKMRPTIFPAFDSSTIVIIGGSIAFAFVYVDKEGILEIRSNLLATNIWEAICQCKVTGGNVRV